MRRVRRRNTLVEQRLAAALRRRHLQFSMHASIYGCTPDIVFTSARVAIFVDGDFWHGRILVERGRQALSGSFKPIVRDFWVTKITRNVARDVRQSRLLRRNGWAVMRLWEKEVLRDSAHAAAQIQRILKRRLDRLKPLSNVF